VPFAVDIGTFDHSPRDHRQRLPAAVVRARRLVKGHKHCPSVLEVVRFSSTTIYFSYFSTHASEIGV
jgi:hypothetical protein